MISRTDVVMSSCLIARRSAEDPLLTKSAGPRGTIVTATLDGYLVIPLERATPDMMAALERPGPSDPDLARRIHAEHPRGMDSAQLIQIALQLREQLAGALDQRRRERWLWAGAVALLGLPLIFRVVLPS